MTALTGIPGVGRCRECDRLMRSSHSAAADHPGAVRHHGHGLCERCCKRRMRGSTGAHGSPHREPWPCTECGRLLRPGNTTAGQWPGTLTHAGRGLCHRCAKGGTGALQRVTPDQSCIDCGRPMRPSHSTADQHPGTVLHAAHGLCGRCYKYGAEPDCRDDTESPNILTGGRWVTRGLIKRWEAA